MRVLLTTLGSHGDIHPFIALARALTRRGHQALLATNPHFKSQALRGGVDFADLTEHADLKDIMQTHGVMDPKRGTRVVLKELTLPMTPELFRRTGELIREFKPDVHVNHPICLGAPWAAEKAGVPVVSVALAPISWMRSHDPIVFGAWRSHNPRPYATRLDAWVGRFLIRFMLDADLNRIRRDLGLSKGRDLLISEFIRPGLNLGLWAPAFRARATGDPAGSRICGWAWFDEHHDHQTDARELDEFLAQGDPPIVFTLGSAAVYAPGSFYSVATEVARRMRRRAVLLVGRRENVEQAGVLPPGVRAFSYAPFSTLLPRACATVHHGGIGSTGQALRAGRPSVVVPMAHDQFDNAARCKRLGVSDTVFSSRLNVPRLEAALRRVLEDPGVLQRVAALAPQIAALDGAETAATALEEHFGSPMINRMNRSLQPARAHAAS